MTQAKKRAPVKPAAEAPKGKPVRATVATPRHWHGERDAKNVHWLSLDKSNSSTNTLSQDVLAALEVVLDELDADPPAGLIIRSGKPNGFIAGADISEFQGLSDPDRVAEIVRRGHAILDRFEALPYPTVALIHGFCLGGGLELALACRYRIAADDARIGLPEVRLGIHPGLGGTARLTRLISPISAMGMMLTGRSLRARAARRLGVIDAVTQPRHFERAAHTAIFEGLKRRRRLISVALGNLAPLRWLLGVVMRRQVAAKARSDHYPAPYALIDLWQRHGGFRARMMRHEADSIARLITAETAQNLIRVFLLGEDLKALGKAEDHDIRHIHVIGAGTMGGDIAAWCALQGLRVTLQDREAKFIAPAIGRAARYFKRRLREPAKVRAALDRLIPDLNGAGVPLADVVIEAVPEQLEIKQALLRDIEPKLKRGALIGTNTSSIPLEQLAEVLKHPDRLIGLHFFNPVAQMPLLEVVRGGGSSPEAMTFGQAFARKIDKIPLPVNSAPGFLVNRVLTPYLLEAVSLLQDGQTPEAIDGAALDFGMPMGPLELADAVGLDICLHVGQIVSPSPDWQPPAELKRLVEKGHLGRKSGRGFYRYKNGKKVGKQRVKGRRDPTVQNRLMLPLLNACVGCLREKLVESVDHLDAGLIYGAGFAPFRGGPIHYLRSDAGAALLGALEDLTKNDPTRYPIDPGWKAAMGLHRQDEI
ncbi:MAG: 3-hydroxyacyl-CoA dehydrogenase NAD-binding domain-containing protein [Alphaproteobacteria bacterium]|nr:3-hydroxyacyl-CoA dehydrogenase NAD-binding domain-containing protein [Alphaproteobacteria bacterium]